MQKGEQTRKRIIETAAVLFNKAGFDGTSMLDVSAAVGLEKGSLYTHFNSKEDLAREAFDFACEQSFAESIENIDKTASPVEKIKVHIRNLTSKPHFPGGCPMMNIAMMSDEGNTILHQRAREMLSQWVTFFAQLIEDGKQAGQIQDTLDGKAFATLAISLLEGAYLTSTLQRSKGARLIAEEHLCAYLDGFVVQVGKNSRTPKERPRRKSAKL